MVRTYVAGLCLAAVAVPAMGKPIAFADGTTVMAEYGAGTMQELQVFYAPSFNYSVGGGHIDYASDLDGSKDHINYARLNYLVHRWNLDAAQGNLFAWGGVGSATGNRFDGTRATGCPGRCYPRAGETAVRELKLVREAGLAMGALLASSATLVCCVLPAMLVALGVGAALACFLVGVTFAFLLPRFI
jgi:hypothetical protein